MTAEAKIQSLLVAAAGVTALVGAAKMRVGGDWQGLTVPYVIHGPVGMRTTQCHGGPAKLREWDYYQISVYAASYGAARAIALAIETALDGYHDADVDHISYQRLIPFDYDTDLKIQHLAMDFSVAGGLS